MQEEPEQTPFVVEEAQHVVEKRSQSKKQSEVETKERPSVETRKLSKVDQHRLKREPQNTLSAAEEVANIFEEVRTKLPCLEKRKCLSLISQYRVRRDEKVLKKSEEHHGDEKILESLLKFEFTKEEELQEVEEGVFESEKYEDSKPDTEAMGTGRYFMLGGYREGAEARRPTIICQSTTALSPVEEKTSKMLVSQFEMEHEDEADMLLGSENSCTESEKWQCEAGAGEKQHGYGKTMEDAKEVQSWRESGENKEYKEAEPDTGAMGVGTYFLLGGNNQGAGDRRQTIICQSIPSMDKAQSTTDEKTEQRWTALIVKYNSPETGD